MPRGNPTHGHTVHHRHTPTYNSWSNMVRRCTNPDHPRYPDWGGRGITVCERWRKFANFLADMGEKPPGMTLDRRDNDGPYDPDNCAWVSYAAQARNKRSSRLTREVVFQIKDLHGAGHGVQEIAKIVGIHRHAVGNVITTIEALS